MAVMKKTEAVRTATERCAARLAAWKEKEKERQCKKAELVEAGLEARYANDFASGSALLAKVAAARARARAVEAEAKVSSYLHLYATNG